MDCCGQVQQLTLISIQGGCHCGLGRFVAFLCCISAVDFVPSAATNALDDGAVFSPPPPPPPAGTRAFFCISMILALSFPAESLKRKQ